jgi:DNA (cytosine-5)-methyltransferase 1
MRVLDLFSGIGGFSLGMERAGMATVAFCEKEEFPRQVLAKHWPGIPIYKDIRELTGEQLEKEVGPIDLICGGFPCQDISNAGLGAGLSGQQSGLWFEFARLIKEVGPRWVIIENVAALRSKGLVVVLQNLWSLGYDAEWHCIPASAIGAPHQRDRIWIVAHSQCNRDRRKINSSKTLRSETNRSPSRASRPSEVMANTTDRQANVWKRREPGSAGGCCGLDPVADPIISGSSVRQGLSEISETELQTAQRDGDGNGPDQQWPLKPGLGRGYDGISSWLDGSWEWEVPRTTKRGPIRAPRLKALGNAVIPQIPELIGRIIMKAPNAPVVANFWEEFWLDFHQ